MYALPPGRYTLLDGLYCDGLGGGVEVAVLWVDVESGVGRKVAVAEDTVCLVEWKATRF
jgi:hypothetical protein